MFKVVIHSGIAIAAQAVLPCLSTPVHFLTGAIVGLLFKHKKPLSQAINIFLTDIKNT